jgi:hypothetical protein
MSRLDIYKKQAKQLVRWHREGNYSIGGRIRGLARYQSLTDREALAREFSPENIAATGRSSTASRSHCRYRFVQLCLRLPRQTKGAFLDTGFRTPNASGFAGGVCGRGRSRTRRLDGEAGAGVCTAESEREETLLAWWPLVTRF